MMNDNTAQTLNQILSQTGIKFWFAVRGEAKQQGFVSTIAQLAVKLTELDAAGWDVYHSCSGFKDGSSRTQANVSAVRSLWLDIDAGPGKPYADADAAWVALEDFCAAAHLPLPLTIQSGFGLHAYWPQPADMTPEQWLLKAKALKVLAAQHGLQVDNSRTCDLSSVLRPPGTKNRKPGRPVTDVFVTYDGDPPQEFLPPPAANINSNFTSGIGSGNSKPDMTQGYPDGERTAALLTRVGWCLGPLNMSSQDTLAEIKKWNQYNMLPLPDDKLQSTINSLHKSEQSKRREQAKETFDTEHAKANPGEWPEPDMKLMGGYRSSPPIFPAHLFGDFWNKWLIESAESKSAPVDYVAAGLMTSACALVGNARFVTPWEKWEEPPIFWACCIGSPSSSKTPGINAVIDMMREIEADINPDYEDRRKEYERLKAIAEIAEEEWKKQVKTDHKAGKTPLPMPDSALEPEKPFKRRIMVMDTTVEIIAPMLEKNPKGLMVFRDELSGWFNGLNQYKGGSGSDRAFYLEAYNGKSYIVDRVKWGLEGSLCVPYLTISIVGGIQPEKFSQAVVSEADDGMTARFTYFYPESVPPKRPTSRPDDGRALAALRKLQALELWHETNSAGKKTQRPFYIRLEPKAADALDKFRQEIHKEEKSASGHYLSYLGKSPGKALRIALMIECLQWSISNEMRLPEFISEKSMVSALELIQGYFNPMACRAFNEAILPEQTRNAMTLAKRIIRDRLSIINTRNIQKARQSGLNKAEKIDEAIAELIAANWLAPAPDNNATGGRPKKDFLVNPKIWEQS